MKVTLKGIAVVTPFLFITMAFSKLGVVRLQAQGGAEMEHKNNFQRVNDKARDAVSGNARHVTDLADEIFAGSDLNLMPNREGIKEHLVRAELKYREGKAEPIHEKNVVDLINYLSASLETPEYATTSQSQVRLLRLALLTQVPALVGRDSLGDGKTMSDTMSPLEAAFLTLTLIHQKLHNPAFQVTPKEWEHRRYENTLEGWKAFKAGNEPTQRVHSQGPRVSQNTSEIRSVLKKNIAAKSDAELSQMLDASLKLFGLEPLEVK